MSQRIVMGLIAAYNIFAGFGALNRGEFGWFTLNCVMASWMLCSLIFSVRERW